VYILFRGNETVKYEPWVLRDFGSRVTALARPRSNCTVNYRPDLSLERRPTETTQQLSGRKWYLVTSSRVNLTPGQTGRLTVGRKLTSTSISKSLKSWTSVRKQNILVCNRSYPRTNSMGQLCAHSETFQHFMEPESLLPRSQKPSTGPYPEPQQSHTLSPRFILIFSKKRLTSKTVLSRIPTAPITDDADVVQTNRITSLLAGLEKVDSDSMAIQR
jgi:hypothetical protein